MSKTTRSGFLVAAHGAAAALLALVIVSVLDFGAIEPSGSAAAARPAAAILPAVWHETPQPVADFAWEDAGGASVKLADFAGKPVLLNLWATWCAPCIHEMPLLDALAGDADGEFAVVVLNQDRALPDARAWWEERGFAHLRLYLDPGLAAFRALSVRGLPLTLLIDARGREVGRVEGVAEWTSPEIAAFVRGLTG